MITKQRQDPLSVNGWSFEGFSPRPGMLRVNLINPSGDVASFHTVPDTSWESLVQNGPFWDAEALGMDSLTNFTLKGNLPHALISIMRPPMVDDVVVGGTKYK